MKVATATKDAARLLHEGSLCMSGMEKEGIRIDVGYLESETAKAEKEIADLKAKMYDSSLWADWSKLFGKKAQLNSRDQLGKLCFELMGFPRGRSLEKKDRREDGGKRKPKLDEATFSKVPLDFIKDYFHWKKLEKMVTTYFYGIKREMVDGRIHPFFHVHKVVSYRSSSSEPNFHNLPSRNRQYADRVRKAVIPDEGCALIEVDYSGAEVKAACCYTKDPRLISDFTLPDKDPHGDTACLMFRLNKDAMTRDAKVEKDWKKGPRDWLKNRFVFPQFFGSCWFQCAPHIWEAVEAGYKVPGTDVTVLEHLRKQGITSLGDCDMEERPKEGTFAYRVKEVEDSFWNERFPVYTAWKRRWYDDYLRDGWFRLYSGFVVSGLLNKNDVLNYPIQGFAFHWLLWSVITIGKELKRRKMKSRLVGQIHDSLQANVPEDEIPEFCDLVVDVMTRRCAEHWKEYINIKLGVEVEVSLPGTTWADKAVWTKKEGKWGKK